jgi:hypothetical protein
MDYMENAGQESIESTPSDSANKTVSTKLSTHELSQLEAIAKRSNLTISSLIRELILAKIQKEKGPPKADFVLAEIVAVKLILMNIFAPIAWDQELMTKQRVEAILAEIKKVKHKAALEIQNGETRK